MLTAPFDSTVVSLQAKAGELVDPGEVALVLEDQTHMYIDAQVSEVDVNRIKLNQSVEVTLDAVFGKTYHGKIIEIGASGVSSQGIVNFPVRIELTDRDAAIRTGMTAVVRVQVETVKDAILVPNSAVRLVDGERVVFIDKGGPIPEKVIVKLGVSSDTMSQVLEGNVKAGDVIILNPDMLIQADVESGE